MDTTNSEPSEMPEPEMQDPKMETRTICSECNTPAEKVCEVREPNGGVYLLCDMCLEAVEDTVDILNEKAR